MGRAEVKAVIDAASVPSVHMAWLEGHAPELPWCAFYLEDTDGVYADDGFAAKANRWVIELYQKQSDSELEDALEESITARFGPFSKSETWVSNENCIQTSYYFKEI